MILNLGDVNAGSTVRIPFNTSAVAGESITIGTNGTIAIYKDGSTTERSSANGVTFTEDHDTHTGTHVITIDLSDNTDAGFYAAGSQYMVKYHTATIDGKSVNVWVGMFTIDKTTVKANAVQLGGVAQSLTDLKDFADTGYDPATHKVAGVVLTDTVTTYTGNTPQTGDAYAVANTRLPAALSSNGNIKADMREVIGTPNSATGLSMAGDEYFLNQYFDANIKTIEDQSALSVSLAAFAADYALGALPVSVSSVEGNVAGSIGGGMAGNVAGSVGSMADAGASLTALGDARIANLNATVSSRMATYTQPTGFLAATFPASPAAVGSAMTLANGAITEATITTPAETAGRPTGILAMMRRIFEWKTNKRIRTRATGALQLRNAADSADLETQTQSTAGGVGSEVDTQTKGV